MKEKLSKIYDLIQEKWIKKDSVFIFLDIFDRNLKRNFEENLDKKTFENLFFRQFFMMLKHNKKEQFLESFLNLLKYKNEIIFLCEKFHFELIIKDFQVWEQIFRIEIFEILLFHYEKYKNLLENWIQKLSKIPLFSIFDSEKFLNFDLVFHIFDKSLDMSDCSNWFTLSLFWDKKEIYAISFFIWENNILIWNIQWFLNKKLENFINYKKVLLFSILEISKNLERSILWFSNKNHPCRFHKVWKWFCWDYDNILKNFWMDKLNKDYYFWEKWNLEVKKLNEIIKQNISNNIDKFLIFLK